MNFLPSLNLWVLALLTRAPMQVSGICDRPVPRFISPRHRGLQAPLCLRAGLRSKKPHQFKVGT